MAVIYFFYTIGKRVEESKKEKAQQPAQPKQQPAPRSTFEQILEEIKRQQAELEKKAQPTPKPVQKSTPKPVKKTGRDIIVHQKPVPVLEEGSTNFEAVYEREITAEEKIERGTLKVKNEGVYKIESIQEMEEREKQELADNSFVFNPRNAIISQIVLERKF